MYASNTQTKRNPNRRNFYGTNFCLSVPYHKLNRLEKIDELMRIEGWESRSQMILSLIDKRYAAVSNGGLR